MQANILEQPTAPEPIEALRLGDAGAFDALFRAHYPALYRYAATFTDGDGDEAEDLVQQTFVKLWEQRENLLINWSPKAYLYRTIHNAALNRLRAARVRERYKTHNLQQMESAQIQPAHPETELRGRFQKALEILPRECRRVFELSRFEELKYREIAETLGISIKTVETQMGKALRVMRVQLADYLVSVAGFALSGLGFWASGFA